LLKGSADASSPEPIGPDHTGAPDLSSVPPIGDLDYRVLGLLQTDSKMSEILVATDAQAQTVIFKIACVQQRARAETNRRAIHNSVVWMEQLCGHSGIAHMQPIRRKAPSGLRTSSTPPTFVATLATWPGNPEFLLMEYLAGGTLSKFVGKRPLPIDLALVMAYELAQTLAYLHEHQCVHRDLKPENILFRLPPTPTTKAGDLQPVLIDFGVAARVGEPKLICGSRLWMAPELQDAHEKSLHPVDPAWDLYALGLICCYMFSGLRPRRRQYDAQDTIDYRQEVFAILQQGVANADTAWQHAIGALQPILAQTLQLDPRQRPTAAEFANSLAALLTDVGIALPVRNQVFGKNLVSLAPFRVLNKSWWQQMPQPWPWIALMCLGLVIVLSILSFWGGTPTARPLANGSAALEQSTTLELAAIGMQAAGTTPSTTKLNTQERISLPQTLVQPTLPPPTLAALPIEPPLADLALIRLLSPPANTLSAQEQVEFAWESLDSRLSAAHCYELVFWDPTKAQDKRAPLGPSHTPKALVPLNTDRASPDPLLRAMVRNPQGFDWGVRIVNCATPQTILQDVKETRHYTYQP
jgi:serine/threonine protein kinase